MKRLILLLISLFTITAFAQEGWYYQTPKYVRDIHFIQWNKAVAVGNGIWISTDVGKSWEGFHPGFNRDINEEYPQENLNAVHFPNSMYGYAVGNPNLIVKTSNGGTIWHGKNPSLPFSWVQFKDVKFVDSEIGFVVGMAYDSGVYTGILIKTSDGGDSWELIYESSSLFEAIEITESNIIWAGGGSSFLIKSTDMGSTWTDVDAGLLGVPYDIKFINDNEGLLIAGNAGYIYRTTDGGSTWETLETGLSGSASHFSYLVNGVVYMTLNGSLYKSTNHAENWSLTYEGTNLARKAVFSDESRGIVCWSNSTAGMQLFATTNGGDDFKEYDYSINYMYLRENNAEGWASNYKQLLKTTDGKRWEAFDFIHNNGEEKLNDIRKFQFLTSNKGFGIGYMQLDATTSAPRFLETTDGGLSWDHYTFENNPFDFHFVDETYGWAAGYLGSIYKTLDGAETWGPQISSNSQSIRGIYFYDENTGWAVGDNNTILKATNGGLLWDSRTPGTPYDSYNAVMSYGENVCFAVGLNTIIKSADGGDTWTDVTPSLFNGNGSTDLFYRNKIIMKSTSSVYVYFQGIFYKSNDGGGTWNIIGPIVDLHVQDGSNMWAAKDGIIHTSNGGVVDVKENKSSGEIVTDYKLYQNYPNPFNPITIISYSIPEDNFIQLKIYNSIGEEISALVNEFKKAGEYRIVFDASQLASGIYLYTLQTDTNVLIRKMLLLK
ncbi:MAG: T9SS type A sorting domain-containing protein [Melioribacteraceae bacterium]|nr:T9SS type A sorting domain-containing protein [Melioribacteraceae bacterium]MCF8354263.1 T9SS type A sorting domain-containing protein [Melioribacteraceae bacterium]MCF8396260.1 T9SS type A sorting domain-containing protein [Melioribacteraceae bacterium]MCF8419726.1 T9SS type A sorting domain-containing protein [Melioribacteraceae bacterium]